MRAKLAVVLVAVAVAASSRVLLEDQALALGRIRDPTWLPSGRALGAASLGQRLLLADAFWLRLVQYVGEMTIVRGRWDALLPLAEIVTDLDPRYGYAYQIAGSNLSGLAGRVNESYRILEKGMRNVPDRWSLPFLYAFNKYYYEGDYRTAAEYARRAARLRPQLALLAANLALASETDEEYTSTLAFLDEAVRQAETPELRAEMEARRTKVRTYAVLDRVERAVAEFRSRYVRSPISLEELVLVGLLPAIPTDPAGGTIAYDLGTGKVSSTALGERKPVRVRAIP